MKLRVLEAQEIMIEPRDVRINGVMVARVIADHLGNCPMRIANLNAFSVN